MNKIEENMNLSTRVNWVFTLDILIALERMGFGNSSLRSKKLREYNKVSKSIDCYSCCSDKELDDVLYYSLDSKYYFPYVPRNEFGREDFVEATSANRIKKFSSIWKKEIGGLD
jgi:hypothetical protein